MVHNAAPSPIASPMSAARAQPSPTFLKTLAPIARVHTLTPTNNHGGGGPAR